MKYIRTCLMVILLSAGFGQTLHAQDSAADKEAQSQASTQHAAHMLQKAKADLDRAGQDPAGHNAKAEADIDAAIQELQAGQAGAGK